MLGPAAEKTMLDRTFSLYAGRDPRDVPLYSVGEAGRYLGISPSTIYSWAKGDLEHRPLIMRPEYPNDLRLSFKNVVEAFAIYLLRKRHRVSLSDIRTALLYAEEEFGVRHLLTNRELLAVPGSMFIERYGQLVNLSKNGQLGIKIVLDSHLKRLDLDESGETIRFFPLTRPARFESPRIVALDPSISFGKPVVMRRGIRTSAIVSRFRVGETIGGISEDYELEISEIEEAIRYEIPDAA